MKYLLTPLLIFVISVPAKADPRGDADAAEVAAGAAYNNAEYERQKALTKMGEAQMAEAMYYMMGGQGPHPLADAAWQEFERYYGLGSTAMDWGNLHYMNGWMWYMQEFYAAAWGSWTTAKSKYGEAGGEFVGAQNIAQFIIDYYTAIMGL